MEVVVDSVVVLEENTGDFFSLGVDTVNSREGDAIAPYVLTFEFDVMITAGGCCWFF